MTKPIAPAAAVFLCADAIRGGTDLLMRAHKSHFDRADDRLAARGLGGVHHRVLYVVSRRQGGSIKSLLSVLGITKQSLGRVVNTLIDDGLLECRTSTQDCRVKMLYLTDKGAALEQELFDQLNANMARAYAAAGEEAVAGYWTLMQHLMNETARRHFLAFNDAS